MTKTATKLARKTAHLFRAMARCRLIGLWTLAAIVTMLAGVGVCSQAQSRDFTKRVPLPALPRTRWTVGKWPTIIAVRVATAQIWMAANLAGAQGSIVPAEMGRPIAGRAFFLHDVENAAVRSGNARQQTVRRFGGLHFPGQWSRTGHNGTHRGRTRWIGRAGSAANPTELSGRRAAECSKSRRNILGRRWRVARPNWTRSLP